jgi:hypothetical protein
MKTLGLIAMSGVRVVNPELISLGLTLPGFIERGKVIASLPTLGLLTLAGLTPDHWELSYHDVFDINKLEKPPGPFDLVAISSLAAQIEEAYALADRYRAEGSCVVMGGLHVSAEPQEALQHADAIVIGEAEPVWAKLLEDFEAGRLQRLYKNEGPQFDLANSPMPRFDLLDPAHYNRITVQTQRGCPFKCEFCAASIRIAPQFQTKPIERVVAELHEIKKLWRHPFIELADDNTFANRARGKQLVRALAAENIHWFTETDISVADDPELLRLLRESGCSQILIGLESPVIAGMDGLEQKANWKAKQVKRLSDGDPTDPGPWHHRQRLLYPRFGWVRSGDIRSRLAVRAGNRLVRGTANGFDAVRRNSALSTSGARRPSTLPEAMESMYSVRRQFPAGPDDRGDVGSRSSRFDG